MNSSSHLIPVESTTNNQASQHSLQQNNFINNKSDNFDCYDIQNQLEMSEQVIMSNVNSDEHNTIVHQMNTNSNQSGFF